MRGELRILPYDEFEFWLRGLTAHLRQRRIPSVTDQFSTERHNYSEEVRTALLLIRRLSALSPQTMIQPLVERQKSETESKFGASSVGLGTNLKRVGEHLVDFHRFRTALENFKTLGMGLARHQSVSRQQFDAFSSLALERIASYRESECRQRILDADQRFRLQEFLSRHVLIDVEMEGVRDHLQSVLGRYLVLLCLFQFMQQEIRISFQPRLLLPLLTFSYHASLRLIRTLQDTKSYLGSFSREWAQAVQVTCGGMKLETKQAFQTELGDLSQIPDNRSDFVQIDRVVGLLLNLFQQSFVSLATVLNPRFDERTLPNSSEKRYRESLQLLEHLEKLQTVVARTQASEDGAALNPKEVVREMGVFQANTMKHLFSRDWQTFLEFWREFNQARADEWPRILHRLEVYLSALIGEVRKRSVLAKHGADSGGTEPDSRQQIVNW